MFSASDGVTFTSDVKGRQSDLLNQLHNAEAKLELFGDNNLELRKFYQDEVARLQGELTAAGLYEYNAIEIAGHGWNTGDAVVYRSATSGTAGDIGGLIDGQTYYVRKINNNIISLMTAPGGLPQNDVRFAPGGSDFTHSLRRGSDAAKAFDLTDLAGGAAVTQPVMTVTIDPIWAEAGMIDIRGDQLYGNGVLDAPGDASVTITNNTPAFLEIMGITIPDNLGGTYFNGFLMDEGNAEISAENAENVEFDNEFLDFDDVPDAVFHPAQFTQITQNSVLNPPEIIVRSPLNVHDVGSLPGHSNAEEYPWPSITVMSTEDGGVGIRNLNGLVRLETLQSGKGDINIFGPVLAGQLEIIAGGNFYFDGGPESQLSTGGNPEFLQFGGVTQNGAVNADLDPTGLANALANTPDGFINADKIFISAEYLNINGTLQSGQAHYDLTIGGQPLIDKINAFRNNPFATGRLYLSELSTTGFDVYYNKAFNRLDVEEFIVNGGHIELQGHIYNTGGGNINLLGGYADINVTNNTNFDMAFTRLDNSKRGDGTLIIIDKSKFQNDTTAYATIYQQHDDGTITRTIDDGIGGAATSVTNVGQNSTYDTKAGWRYGWTVGYEQTERKTAVIRSSSWLGIIDLGENYSGPWDEIEPAGPPVLMGDGPYFYEDPVAGNQTDPYLFSNQTVDISTPVKNNGPVEVEYTSWYGTKHYKQVITETVGQQVLNTHSIKADYDIGIHFFGDTEGAVTVHSNGGGKVLLNGGVLNPSGTTTITSNSTVESLTDAGVVSGKRIVVDAANGIGNSARALQTDVTDVSGNPTFTGYATFDDTVGNIFGFQFDFGPDTITRSGGSWLADGFAVGQEITVSNANGFKLINGLFVPVSNNGTFTIQAVTASTITVTETGAFTDFGKGSVTVERTGGAPVSVPGLSLNAATDNGNIYINEIKGDLPIDQVRALNGGKVVITANDGDIEVGKQNSSTFYSGLVSGGSISLTASGSIGNGEGRPLQMNSGVTTFIPLGLGFISYVPSSKVDIVAGGDVSIRETTGNLRLNTLHAGGNVYVHVANGSLLDDNQVETRDDRAFDELKGGVWKDLRLTESTGVNDKIADAKQAFIQVKNQEYQSYWNYRSMQPDGGAVYDPAFEVALSATEQDYYEDFYASQGMNDTQVDAAIQTLVNSRTDQYHALHAQYGGYGDAYNPSFNGSFDPATAVGANAITVESTSKLATGDLVRYSSGGGAAIGGLQNGERYYARVGATGEVFLALSKADALAGTNLLALDKSVATGTSHSLTETIDYQLTAEEDAGITNSIKVWTEEELFYLIGNGLIKPVSDTVTDIEDPNIIGQNVTIVTSAGVGNTTGQKLIDLTDGIAGLDTEELVALSAAERSDVVFLGGDLVSATVNFNNVGNSVTGDTITRSSGSWLASGFQAGMKLFVQGNTSNETDVTSFFTIQSVTASTITLVPGDNLTPEVNRAVQLGVAVPDPTFEATATPIGATVQFATNGANPDTITRTDGGDWSGFAAGDLIKVGGTTPNASEGGETFRIVGIDGATLVLAASSHVIDESSVSVSITKGRAPTVENVLVIEREDIDVDATGGISITAATNVFLGSENDIRLNQVTAGDTVVGDNIRIKGAQDIINNSANGTANVRGADVVLEAGAGHIGENSAAARIYVDIVGSGALTARALNDVNIAGVNGNLAIESVFSKTGVVRLSTTGGGAIIDGVGGDFTKVMANRIELDSSGAIGEPGDHLEVDVTGTGTLTATANTNIFVAESEGNMNIRNILSRHGDVDLKAQLFILDAVDIVDPTNPNSADANPQTPDPDDLEPWPGADITARGIKLSAIGIGVSGNAIDINSSHNIAVDGTGAVSASSTVGNIYLIETVGDMYLGQVSSAAAIAFITAPAGSILNGAAAGVSNVASGATRLFAANDIGSASKALWTEVGNLQGRSTAGSTYISNQGALTVTTVDDDQMPDDGEDTANAGANGAEAGGSVYISASSPVTVDKDILSNEEIVIVAHDDNNDSDFDGTATPNVDDDADFIRVLGGVTILSDSYIRLLAGDNLYIESGAHIVSPDHVELQVDFQGDTLGNPAPQGQPNADAGGGQMFVNGSIDTPETVLRGGDQADQINIDLNEGEGEVKVTGHITVKAGDGNDLVTVNKLRTREDSVLIDGEGGSDVVVVNLTDEGPGGTGENYLINVFDTGKSGTDYLVVNGTAAADTFLLRASESASGVAFVAAIHGDPAATAERINYNKALEHLVVDAKAGDDVVALDDNWAQTTILGGTGQDRFQVGQIFKSARDAASGVAAADIFHTVETTRGFLSNGVSYQTTINGGDDADNFTVFRNTAPLSLLGGAGDDTFTMRAFALEGSVDSTVAGGFGANLVLYVMNAPIHIDGGEGTDTVRVIGTEFADQIVVTASSIIGMGVQIDFTGVEKLEIDAAEGDDTFYVLGTAPTVETRLFGGLGSDHFIVGGDVPMIGSPNNPVYPGANGPHVLEGIDGLLVLDGGLSAGTAGGLGEPVMLPGETNALPSDGTVLGYSGTGAAGSIDSMTLDTAQLLAFLAALPTPSANLNDLVGRTLEISQGPGMGRFWLIQGIAANGAQATLTLKNASQPAVDWGVPAAGSKFAISSLSSNFFVPETEQVDFATIYNDGAKVGQTGTLTANTLRGLGMVNGIDYGNLESMEVFLGSGADTFNVTGSMSRSDGFRTITSVSTGAGDDNVTISLSAATDGVFALNGEGGNDTIVATGSTVPLILFGGEGSDLIRGGQASDVIFGDRGQFDYRDDAGNVVTRLGLDLSERGIIDPKDPAYIDNKLAPNYVPAQQTDGNVEERITAFTRDPLAGAADDIDGYAGNDVIFGGAGGDTITANLGGKIILGDFGRAELFGAVGETNDVFSTDEQLGGSDHIIGGSDGLGNIMIGGGGDDFLSGGSGNDVILGDSGHVYRNAANVVTRVASTAPGIGGKDTIDGGAGTDVIMGGADDDRITALSGGKIILGDNGTVSLTGTNRDVESIAYDIGGDDEVSGGTGGEGNIIIGGAGSDTKLFGGAGDDIILGDNGKVTRVADDLGNVTLVRVETIAPDIGGEDIIQGGAGTDIIMGGARNDRITTSLGNKIILGDNGTANLSGDNRDVYSDEKDPGIGGVDTIIGGADGAGNIIIGGAQGDFISGGQGNDVILGDTGRVRRSATGALIQVFTTAPNIGGADTITGGAGIDIIMGGAAGDDIRAPQGNKIILGDNGVANLSDLADPLNPNRDVYTTNPEDEFGGADYIEGGGDGQGNILIGGSQGDTIKGGNGNDVILGDSGYVRRAADGSLIRVNTIAPSIGGVDDIEGGAGFDIIMGGAMGDRINAPSGGKIILGDNGQVNLAGSDRDVFSTDYDIGGIDTIVGGANSDGNIIIGGAEGDEISAGTGDDVILGDNGRVYRRADETLVKVVTLAPEVGGTDNIRAGNGFDVVFGGAKGDNIEAGLDASRDVVVGDNGYAVFDAGEVLVEIRSTDPGIGGDDNILVGNGDDFVIGGIGVDYINMDRASNQAIGSDNGKDTIIGDNGYALFDPVAGKSVLREIATTAPEHGDRDYIFAGNGQDVVLGGSGGDFIDAGTDGSRDIVIGDNGRATFSPTEVLLTIRTTDPAFGGDDDIRTGNGADIVLGGSGNDLVLASGATGFQAARDLIAQGRYNEIDPGDAVRDIVLGDNGEANFNAAGVLQNVKSTDTSIGGNDLIVTGRGDDVVIAGMGADKVLADGGDEVPDMVIGDSGFATFDGSAGFLPGEEEKILSFNFTGADQWDAVTGVAGTGAARAGNWNNLNGGGYRVYGDDAGEILVFDDGSIAPGIGIQWGADLDSTSWHDPDRLHLEDHSQINPGTNQDKLLFDGYLTSDYHDTVGVNISGLASHFKTYDVYVYLDMEDSDSKSGTSVRSIDGNGLKYYLNDPDGNTFTGTYVQATSTTSATAQKGNYVVFRNVTSDTFKIRIDDVDPKSSGNKPGVAAVQVLGKSNAIDRIESIDSASGGDDVILTGGGDDIVFGGAGNDVIRTAGNAAYGAIDNDIVAGDDARATFMNGELRSLVTLDPETGASGPAGRYDDTIWTGNGDDVVIGGNGSDLINTSVSADDYDYGNTSVISMKFNSQVDQGGVTGTAGAVAADHWNNLASVGKGTQSALVNDDGGTTGVKVTWGEEQYNAKTRTYELTGTTDRDTQDLIDPDSQNERLFESSLERDDCTLGVDLTGLGALGTYDVYVYFDSDEADNRNQGTAAMKITAGGTSLYVNDPKGNTFEGEFVDASSADKTNPGTGNYVVFRGLTLDQLKIRITGDETLGRSADGRPTISGIQIVSGADRAAVIDKPSGKIGGDFDNDVVVGDNASIHWFHGQMYEVTATNPVQTAADSGFQADTIDVGEGADVVIGGNGNDKIKGGEGNDLLLGDNARLLMDNSLLLGLGDFDEDNWDNGHHHDDWHHHDHWHHHHSHFNPYHIMGVELLDEAVGGNDVIEGGQDDDLMYGQSGADRFVFAGSGLGQDAVVEAGTDFHGDDRWDWNFDFWHWGYDAHGHHQHEHDFHGPNDAGDTLDFSLFSGPVTVDLGVSHEQTVNGSSGNGDVNLKLTMFHGDAIENVIGSEFADCIEGNDRDNRIEGLAGNDRLDGGDGYDYIDGGAGNDEILGGGHSHGHYGYHNGWRWHHEDDDADVLLGGDGNDKIWGEGDNDWIEGGNGDDLLYGNGGSDTISGDAGNDKLYGSSGNEKMYGGAGNDLMYGGSGTDEMDGGDGNDILWGESGDDILIGGLGDDQIHGGTGNDKVYGGEGIDQLWGDDGCDTLFGEAGADKIWGGGDDDFINGGEGDDWIYGEDGDDTLLGGYGNDTIKGGDGDDVILAQAGNDTVEGERGRDLVDGGTGDDILKGGDDDDLLLGSTGNDKLYGDDGNDLLDGEDGDDTIYGGNDDDILVGGNGVDWLSGDSGKDKLEGGAGADTLKSDSKDSMVQQETVAGSLGLKSFFSSFAYKHGVSGFSYKDPTNGSSTANDRPVRSWIAAYETTIPGSGDNMVADRPAGAAGMAYSIDDTTLAPIVDAAIGLWTRALGADDARLDALANLEVSVANLGGAALGLTIGNAITLDIDAAGHGWFVDASPAASGEFRIGLDFTLRAGTGSPAFNRMDLLTVVAHEIGHVLGFEHGDAAVHPVMNESLQAGQRFGVVDELRALDHAEAADVRIEERIAEFEAWAGTLASAKGAGAKPSIDFDKLIGPAGGGSSGGVNWSGGLDKSADRFSPFGKTSRAASNLSDFLSSLLDSEDDKKDAGFDEMGGSLNLGDHRDAGKSGAARKL